MTIYTIGHGTRTTEELLDTIRNAGVDLLVDVRRFPGSRRNPQFSRDALEVSLESAGIAYEWRGEDLGGRRSATKGSRHPAWSNAAFQGYADHMDGAEFRTALQDLERIAAGSAVAIMCAETLWWRCHRRLISDALTLRGAEVVHLLGPAKSQPHKIHPNVRPDDEGWPVYDVGVDRPLLG